MVNTTRVKRVKKQVNLYGQAKGKYQRVAKKKLTLKIEAIEAQKDLRRTEKARTARIERAKAKEARDRKLQEKREAKKARELTAQEVLDLRIPREQSKDAAILRSHRIKRVEVMNPETTFINKKESSWIKSFAYDSLNQMMYMTVKKTNKTYEWDHIGPYVASMILDPDNNGAACRTDDTLPKKRWWITKTPSLGATYWKYLSFSRTK